MSEPHRATSLGQTGGLPGANAAPQAAEATPDDVKDTVATGDVGTTPYDPVAGTDADTVADLEQGHLGPDEPLPLGYVTSDSEATPDSEDEDPTGGRPLPP
jgi:hypothetical protein